MRLIVIAAATLLAACQSAVPKQNPPAPAVVNVPVATYVPIDPALRKRCSWERDGKPSAVFEVSNGRKRCLLQYEAQLDGIDGTQGKPVPDGRE
ncbi:hypothetical protein V8017_00160 [Stenotrophomonas rhizophila]